MSLNDININSDLETTTLSSTTSAVQSTTGTSPTETCPPDLDDSRPTEAPQATTIGISMIIILVAELLFIILLDVSNLKRDIRKGKNNLTSLYHRLKKKTKSNYIQPSPEKCDSELNDCPPLSLTKW